MEGLLQSYGMSNQSAFFGASDSTEEGTWMTVDGYSLAKYDSYFPDHTELKKGKQVTIKNKMPNDPETIAEVER